MHPHLCVHVQCLLLTLAGLKYLSAPAHACLFRSRDVQPPPPRPSPLEEGGWSPTFFLEVVCALLPARGLATGALRTAVWLLAQLVPPTKAATAGVSCGGVAPCVCVWCVC